ncbi:hypothetical protein [Mucilaginibacter polytrichastri]|uniref:Uncharacterized protein n=1 Tax=Mucilaginibacter polytrichastri TaxID=1302689 RepID=A0A1Q5ZUD4_9SPHI|nr:hypothetical protein [Mucilaginibacter polytrichastri]OKS85392.1 hypothetical protein RG47T_0838 [Mucilaginibacter polytrichastri]SFS39641.1 hypothetical protein SAMN04487890_101257 [Mucilaginibacter polytrichastri]
MKRLIKTQLKPIFIGLMCLACFKTNAQQSKIRLRFESGKTYIKEIVVKSSAQLQNGQITVSVNSLSTVSKSYKVDAGINGNFNITVVITKITDSISSGKDHFYFDSNKPVDSSSTLASSIAATVGKPYVFQVDSSGMITSVNIDNPILNADTGFNLTGFEPEELSVGKKFPLISDIRSLKGSNVGQKWIFPTLTANGEIMTEFWLLNRSETATTMAFSKTINDQALNTHSTGSYIVDNNTGIITERKIKDFTSGYQTFHNALYFSTRNSTITENCSIVN